MFFQDVIKNLNIAKKRIGCKKNNLLLLKQVHSNKIFKINNILKKKLIGDGFFTSKKNIALGILTADCAPVFIYDKKLIIVVDGWILYLLLLQITTNGS